MNPKSTVKNTVTPAKMRFVPKATKWRAPKSELPKKEEIEDADAIQAKDLLHRFAENSKAKRKNIDTKVSSSQVAFGFGGESKTFRSYGGNSSSADVGIKSSCLNVQKEYKEPWDYYSNYPTSLPIRRPYSGDPEILNEEEFGAGSESMNCDESSTNQAIDLGLMEETMEKKMIYIQLPTILPMVKRSSNNSEGQNGRLDGLPEGLMGKMLVYKSGAVKLKLGDTLYDVSTGVDCIFAQDVVAINTKEKHCCCLGEVTKRAIVTPDVDSLLDSLDD